MGKAKDGLNERERAFCREYIITSNVTQSAIAAGYSEKAAHVTGSRMLKKAKIQTAIDVMQQYTVNRAQRSADEIIKEMEILGFSDIADYLNIEDGKVKLKSLKEIDAEKRRAIKSVKQTATQFGVNIEYVLHDKHKSLEVLGYWHKIGGDGGKNVINNNNTAIFVVPDFKKQDGKASIEIPHKLISSVSLNGNGKSSSNGVKNNGSGQK